MQNIREKSYNVCKQYENKLEKSEQMDCNILQMTEKMVPRLHPNQMQSYDNWSRSEKTFMSVEGSLAPE